MSEKEMVIMDGNEAAASVAYRLSEVVAIYPITPSSPMAEWADQWRSEGKKNIWGALPIVEELQSEGGAAGALHGALQAGAFATTFTASQGLLLMIPNMFKIAGELTPATMHVTARTLATHALSIFGDHSDVMACRSTGWAMLASNSVQECADLALIAQVATLEARIPFMHFFDGFRTSHEVGKILPISDETIREMVDDQYIIQFRQNALSPDRPIIRGTAQNPDVFFQAREACSPYYRAVPGIVQAVMDRFAVETGRAYHLLDYYGASDAERVIILMGSGAEAAEEAVDALNRSGEKVGLLKVRLYRPFDASAFLGGLPKSVKSIAVLDRCKEPGATGEPLYQDIITVLAENAHALPFAMPTVIGGRYGLSSKEFTPAMVKGIFDELTKAAPKNHFTIGIDDDVSHTSLEYDPDFSTEDPRTVRALFYGLGSDGTVGANKNSIKIIGTETDNYAQGYFVYDSKKSGSMTTSHLRFGPTPIRSTYLISKASFIACHNFSFLEKIDVLEPAIPGAVFLLNSPFGKDEVWETLPKTVQDEIIRKKIEFYVIDGYKVARDAGMGTRINTIMQTCFFAISGVLPREEAIAQIKKAIKKTYGKRGEAVVQKNFAAVDAALAHLEKVDVPSVVSSEFDIVGSLSPKAPKFVFDVLGQIASGKGDSLPVSALPAGGAFPTGTAQWEKRNIAQFIPVWDKDLCIQCGKCVMVCPHAVIRSKVYSPDLATDAPADFQWAKPKWKGMENDRYTLQVAPEDCTGCGVCVEVCPVKSKSDASHKAINMAPQQPLREKERENWDFFLGLPEVDRSKLSHGQVKDLQLLQPLFEFSGACSGCGETPYIKLLTQLFGDRLYIANATGCSSIYGGNLPTTPYTQNAQGRGPTWANSLFEDNAEFGFGMRVALDQQKAFAETLLMRVAHLVGDELVSVLLTASQKTETEINAQRDRVKVLRDKLAGIDSSDARNLSAIADSLVRKSVWILGGDGWAFDIGFGGLDHVLGSGKNVNVLVLDTEVYSNTGGQASKATPRGAVAKFAASGKGNSRKDLAMEAVSYGYVYVAQVAMGANDTHVVKAFQEAEAHEGPSIIIAYSSCIAHGYDLVHGLEQQKLAVQSGYWPLMRYNPVLREEGKNPFQLDSKSPSIRLKEYAYREARYTMLARGNPELAAELLKEAQDDVERQWRVYSARAAMPGRGETPHIAPVEKPSEKPEPVAAGGTE
ncbi:pyruvate:ferredoxin (flavodoxin) oxidoreductase [Occallatibacter riparius]|uniref:Pyruvate:ferredoxin (Flavodoxin) oxidoreductase n=1 Tax=Occallatibacter riparius TaxID=1002689 RepID=A0A9J7BM81_9BACT|nr:pyruvate:ferredoxin (flavodoxin) oxidoreductase [Occallatibacter riparius]UWZ83601.1 pyruvate:ferredoxin (flavodoxin) oxidoreductase [Occallatibacter riparius]